MNFLKNDAAAHYAASSTAIHSNNYKRIKELTTEALEFIEKDLDFGEKISLIFLLVADDVNRSRFFLQELIVLSHCPESNSDMLTKFARDCPEQWRNKVAEALCTIQSNQIIRKLGLNVTELYSTFMPHIRDQSIFLHRIVKTLYYTLCEKLSVKQSAQLIKHISTKYNLTELQFKVDSGAFLEVHLLRWISDGIVAVGDHLQGRSNGRFCDFKAILMFLKQNEIERIKDELQTTVDGFNQPRSLNIADESRATGYSHSFAEQPSQNSNDLRNNSEYVIRRQRAGVLLIINQKTFCRDQRPEFKNLMTTELLETREGTDRDKQALSDTFAMYGFQIIVKENLMHDEVMDAIRDVVEQGVHFDSIFICILSHGCKGAIYGANSVRVDLQDIQNTMASSRLLYKPKVLIVQACQGNDTIRAERLQTDGPSARNSPAYSDLLVCVSAVPGFTSFRDTERGSWFIQTLCKKIQELSDSKHLLDILTETSREVQDKRGPDDQCMVPITNSILRRYLKLPKKLKKQ